jgi:hypothetical protein
VLGEVREAAIWFFMRRVKVNGQGRTLLLSKRILFSTRILKFLWAWKGSERNGGAAASSRENPSVQFY